MTFDLIFDTIKQVFRLNPALAQEIGLLLFAHFNEKSKSAVFRMIIPIIRYTAGFAVTTEQEGEPIMGLVLSGTIAGFVFGFQLGHDMVESLFAGFIFAVIGFIGSGMIAAFIGELLPRKWIEVRRITLVSLNNGVTTEGSLSLFGGTIGPTVYHVYSYKLGNGATKTKVLQGDVSVFEEDRDDGVLLVFEEVFESSRYDIFAVDRGGEYRYEFHVPNGSYKREFKLQ